MQKRQKIYFTLNGKKLAATQGETILQAALKNGIYIPNLCYHPDLRPVGACRLCQVEVTGRGRVTACNTEVTRKMVVQTDTPEIARARRTNVELLLLNHEGNCTECSANTNCELQKIAKYVGIGEQALAAYIKPKSQASIDDSNPFFTLDRGKCVLCGICIRTCQERQGIGAIDFIHRGYNTQVAPFDGETFKESCCKSCAECVVRCPTGSLAIKNSLSPSHEVKTVCPYCGCGCSMYLGIRGNEIVGVRGDREGKSNQGSLCVKGRFGYEFVHSQERLTKPLLRKNGELTQVSWEEALDFVANELKKYHGDKFALFSSARCTNEENFVFQKFARAVMGTNNVDHCARLCHAPTVSGLAETLGSGAMTNSIAEIGDAKCILAIGTNTTEAHPIVALQIQRAVQQGAHLIVINPLKIDLCRRAELFLQERPGTDVALIMGMARVIVDEKLMDEEFITTRTEGFAEFSESLKNFSLDTVEKLTGVSQDLIRQAARTYATQKPASILYAMGITQHSHGTDNVISLSNLMLLTGNVGKLSSGINPLRGQNNVQGACDMGALPNVYSGYQNVNNEEVRQKFATAWQANLSTKPGLTLTEILHAVQHGDIEALYIAGENPVLSEADSNHVISALQKAKLLVVQDIFLTETAKLAHVVLPAATFAEKDGTYTNTERRVQRIRQAIPKVGEAKDDWWIICELAKRLGAKKFAYKNAQVIMEEIAELTPSYHGITYKRLEKESLVWPCPDTKHPGTPILHTERFATASGKGKLVPLTFKLSAELPDAEYPLLLTTDRSLFHYHTSTMTRKVAGLNILHEHEWLEINPQDAVSLGITDGQKVKVISRRGAVNVAAHITEQVPIGVVAMTFHFAETPTNVLTNCAVDPVAKIPETKVCAVRVEV